jgi:hypothetical protein
LAKIDIIEKKQLLELNLKQLDKDITKVEKATSNPTDRIDLTQRARSANESDIKLEAESEKLIARVENLRRLNDSLWFWTILWRSVFFTGMVLTVLGFFLWYFRVQRLHDRVLRNEADKT